MSRHAVLAFKSGTTVYITRMVNAESSPYAFRSAVDVLMRGKHLAFNEALDYIFRETRNITSINRIDQDVSYRGIPYFRIFNPIWDKARKEKHQVHNRKEFMNLVMNHGDNSGGYSILVDMDKRQVDFLTTTSANSHLKDVDGSILDFRITRDSYFKD